MDIVKISDMENRLIKNLSKGYRQRVGLAQALLGDPKIVILDEPTVGLDPKQIIEIREMIRSLKERHTVILSSHILSEVSAVCDYVMIINHGRLVASDTPDRLSEMALGSNTLELKAVLADMCEKQWELLTRFLALSGLRFAEFCALDKKDVDFSLMQIHIRKGYDSVNKEITYTKNCFSERDVHIQPELAEVCREINAFTLRRRLRIGSKSKIFFMSSDGGRINYYSYNKYFKAHTLKVTGKELTPHALRHTHASLLFEQGLSIDEVARRLGHGDSEITRAIYIHVTKKLEEKDAARLDGIQLIG